MAKISIFCLAVLSIFFQLQGHGGWHGHVVENHVSVHVGGGWGPHYGWGGGWYHDRVYLGDPWYHPGHVYIYNGDPYAVYYYGRPYYYFDPRFYYFD